VMNQAQPLANPSGQPGSRPMTWPSIFRTQMRWRPIWMPGLRKHRMMWRLARGLGGHWPEAKGDDTGWRKDTGLSRESLYRGSSADGNPASPPVLQGDPQRLWGLGFHAMPFACEGLIRSIAHSNTASLKNLRFRRCGGSLIEAVAASSIELHQHHPRPPLTHLPPRNC